MINRTNQVSYRNEKFESTRGKSNRCVVLFACTSEQSVR